MADLNLDGLPRLAFLVKHTGDSGIEGELRQLVEAERVRGILMKAVAEQRLTAWAKPAMRAVRELACSEPLSDEEDECCDKVRELGETLTEAQLKEIGEDDKKDDSQTT